MGTEPFVVAYARAKLATAINETAPAPPSLGEPQVCHVGTSPEFFTAPAFSRLSTPGRVNATSVYRTLDQDALCFGVPLQGTSTPPVFGTGAGLGGILVMADEHPFIRVRGWLCNSATVGTLFPSLARLASVTDGSTHPVHTDVADTWEALPDAPRKEILEKVKLPSSELIELHTFGCWTSSPPPRRHHLRLKILDAGAHLSLARPTGPDQQRLSLARPIGPDQQRGDRRTAMYVSKCISQ